MTPGDATAVAVLVHALLTDDQVEPQELSYAVEHLITHASQHERGMVPVDEALSRLDELMYGDDYPVHLSGEWHPRFRPIEDIELPRRACDPDVATLTTGRPAVAPVGTVLLTPAPDIPELSDDEPRNVLVGAGTDESPFVYVREDGTRTLVPGEWVDSGGLRTFVGTITDELPVRP